MPKHSRTYDPPREDLTGRIFGRLTVIERCDYSMCGTIWRCRCACGNEAEVKATRLRAGTTKSCGCLKYKKSKGGIL